MAFNSDEVNLLVYRYLEESGFRHSAFTFGYESSVLNAGLDSMSIPRGALMSLLQKGVLFAEAEVFSLLTDGELDSRFEKAIGCMTILECAMCDSAKTKALSRRLMVATTSSATSSTNTQQQQRLHGPLIDQQNSIQQQRRTPSRLTPQTQIATTSSSDQQHQSIITPTTSSTNSPANSLLQNHVLSINPTSRSNEFNSSLSNKQQITANQQIGRDRSDFSINSSNGGRNIQQNQQQNPSSPSPHSLQYPPRASSSSSATSSFPSFRGGGTSSYQQQIQSNDRLCQVVEQVAACNPTLTSTSSTSVTVSNHLHPGTAATSLMNAYHPFYQQQHTFKQHAVTTLAATTAATSSFLPTTGIQMSNGAMNGPTASVSFPTSLSSNLSSTTPHHQQHNLHPHQTTPHNLLGATTLNQQQTAEMTRLMLNGGNNAAAAAAAAYNMASSGGSSISHSLKRSAGGNG
ncbi:hypothetical protein ACQ4LE_006666 [Meloidogyne hapla]|uniref:LisH domain-containing protein n=1 Tax=Meloidogyne hapla TaxID=6305 RepID=A0A1I8BEG5_MELHA